MSMSSDITLSVDTYSVITQRANSTVRSNPTATTVNPEYLTVSHEIAKSGKVSSAVMLDDLTSVPCNDTCQLTPGISTVRAMFKLQYNPNEGDPDIEGAITDVITKLNAFLADSTLITKFRNREH